MTRVAIVADTHLPAAGAVANPVESIPNYLLEHLGSVEYAIHAGDVISPAVLFELRVRTGGEMVAVRGNRDPELSAPDVATLEVDGVRFVVTHGADLGRGEAYRRGLVDLAARHDADVAVGGHTHRLLDASVDGVRVLNPGSATGAGAAPEPTLLEVDCGGGDGDVSVSVRRP